MNKIDKISGAVLKIKSIKIVINKEPKCRL